MPLKPEDLVHSTAVRHAVVTSKNTARFLNGDTLAGDDTFRSSEFGKYEQGTILECQFRISGSKRTLLFARTVELSEATVKVEPTEIRIPLIEEVPEWVNGQYLSPRTRTAFGAIKRIIEADGIVNVLARGPSGYGKTSSFKALADHLGMNFLRVDCSTMLDPEMWFGYQEARGGDTVFIPSPFAEAITSGNTVVVLDEANRIEPWLANSLFPILDDARGTSVHGVDIVVAPRTVFALTINEGVIYAGTHTMDAAFKNRIDLFLVMEALPSKEEIKALIERCRVPYDVAEKIVSVARSLREVVAREELDVDVSTRTTLKVARLMMLGMSMKEAFEYIVTLASQSDDSKAIVDALKTLGL